MKHEVIGLLASLFIALAMTWGMSGGLSRGYDVASLEWRVQAILVAVSAALGLALAILKQSTFDTINSDRESCNA